MPETRHIAKRPFGKSGEQISALGLGGHHLGDAEDQKTAEQIVARAIDGGINFFDNCWEYHLGKSEIWLGGALKGKRQQVFLMTKVCTHGRDKSLALRMLEESLRRLQTDYLDLWQIHGVSFDNDPDLFIRPNGAAEALEQAKREGKVRYVGFTGHKDPKIHLGMLNTGFAFDAAQMPLNPFDATFRSFQSQVIPECQRRGIAVLGMKPLGGSAPAVKAGVVSAEECLRYAMSLPVATTIVGMEKMKVLEENLKLVQTLQPMAQAEMTQLVQRVAQYAADGRYEPYKVSLKFDNPQARLAHSFPLDMQSKEVKEMVGATQNTGNPFPPAK
jgi:predicted aldo/keto reductase-like oxidoreductase